MPVPVKMQKAKIQVLKKGGTKEDIPVMFNPSEYKINKTANYGTSNVQGKDPKQTFYKNGNPTTLTVQLFFDFDTRDSSDGKSSSNSNNDVRKYTEKILMLLVPVKTTEVKNRKPPVCKFIWGTFSFLGYVSSATQSFTRFTKDGIPVRATVDLTFTELADSTANIKTKDKIEKQYGTIEVNLQEELCTQTEKPEDWRIIAQSAEILNPRTEGKKNRPNSVKSLAAKYNRKSKQNDDALEDIKYLFAENDGEGVSSSLKGVNDKKTNKKSRNK